MEIEIITREDPAYPALLKGIKIIRHFTMELKSTNC